ncbi:MAG: hypothetical protein QGH51_09430 [Planctomycetota bacterium]|jgi:acetolactate decarboxylase|nr:hypothetical protein [Planctomycetota bacterium]MDP6942232.1 hypothetical protein [Planctomycetota bacterium]
MRMLPFFLLAASCTVHQTQELSLETRYWGSLRGMMHQGITDTEVSVQEAMWGPHMWGLGAAKDLAGEITIHDSVVHLASPVANTDDPVYSNGEDLNSETALLVLAQVPAWQGIPLERDLPNQAALESWVASQAERLGFDPNEILPFQVIGTASFIQLHVIDGTRLEGAGSSHEEHLATAIKDTWKEQLVFLNGFRSLHHRAIFTHHDTTLHCHASISGSGESGHVDEVAFTAGQTTLLLPKN